MAARGNQESRAGGTWRGPRPGPNSFDNKSQNLYRQRLVRDCICAIIMAWNDHFIYAIVIAYTESLLHKCNETEK